MPIYLAIDAGGTKTQCLLADATSVLARASTGSIKLMRVSEQEATTRLHATLAQVAGSAGIALADITRTCIGLAGLSIPAVRAWATAAISAKVSGELILLGDEEIALDAAFQASPGILVIAGTGSNVIGRAPDGTPANAGGWGPILGDEGSGYWIGLEAIRAALRSHDQAPNLALSTGTEIPTTTGTETPGAPSIPISPEWVGCKHSTSLLQQIQHHWNLTTLADLVAFANHRGDAHQPAPDFAALAPIVAHCAEQGNPLAAAILRRAGEDLANLVTLVAQKMTKRTEITKSTGITDLTKTTEINEMPERTATTEKAEPRVPHPRDSSIVAGWGIERSSTVLPNRPSHTASQAAPISIAYTGSILTHIAPVRAAMIARLAITLPGAQVQPSPIEPLEGALWRARQG